MLMFPTEGKVPSKKSRGKYTKYANDEGLLTPSLSKQNNLKLFVCSFALIACREKIKLVDLKIIYQFIKVSVRITDWKHNLSAFVYILSSKQDENQRQMLTEAIATMVQDVIA